MSGCFRDTSWPMRTEPGPGSARTTRDSFNDAQAVLGTSGACITIWVTTTIFLWGAAKLPFLGLGDEFAEIHVGRYIAA